MAREVSVEFTVGLEAPSRRRFRSDESKEMKPAGIARPQLRCVRSSRGTSQQQLTRFWEGRGGEWGMGRRWNWKKGRGCRKLRKAAAHGIYTRQPEP